MLVGSTAAVLAAELALRAVLFANSSTLNQLSDGFRTPDNYAKPTEDDLWWLLHFVWSDRSAQLPPNGHPRFGWTNGRFDAETMAHEDERLLSASQNGTRHPILLFGDSFSMCLTPTEECFEGLIEGLPLQRDARVLNYGVGGYGFDQTHMVATAALEALAARPEYQAGLVPAPVVAIGLIPDDLDRMALALRDYVKPRYTLEDGQLVRHPAEPANTRAFLERQGLGRRSWLVQHAIYASGLGNRIRRARRDRHRALRGALAEHLVGDLVARLDGMGIEHFFLLMPELRDLDDGRGDWQEVRMREIVEAQGSRLVDARGDFERHMAEQNLVSADYFGAEGPPLYGHYNALGNAVATATLLRGLAGENDAGPPLADPALGPAARVSLARLRDDLSQRGTALTEQDPAPAASGAAEPGRR